MFPEIKCNTGNELICITITNLPSIIIKIKTESKYIILFDFQKYNKTDNEIYNVYLSFLKNDLFIKYLHISLKYSNTTH